MTKSFSLERAKAGDPIQAADGSNMRFGAHLPDAGTWQRVIVVDSDGVVRMYSETGLPHGPYQCLVMAPIKKTVWVNIYNRLDRCGDRLFAGLEVFESEQEAKRHATPTKGCVEYLGAYPTEIEL